MKKTRSRKSRDTVPFRIVCWGGDPVPDTSEPGVAGQAQADQPPPAGHQPQARQAEGAPGTN
jgi:hypothetical protein